MEEWTSHVYDGRGVRVLSTKNIIGGDLSVDPVLPLVYFYTPELTMLNIVAPTTGRTADVIWFGSRPVADHEGTTVRYTFTDHLGTPILQTTASADIAWHVEYEPFGNVYALRAGVDPKDQPLRFPGQQVVYSTTAGEESYNVFRWYRAGWGRYTSSDPIGLRGGINLFAYAEGNPLRWSDPTGLKVFKCCRDVQVNALVDGVMRLLNLKHCFIKTDSIEAGMGPAGGENAPLPTCPIGTQTTINRHTGQSQQSGTQCTEINNVNEQCVNDLLRPGTPTGRWTPVNQCNTFADDILRRCVNCPPPRTNVPDWRPQPSSSIW